MSDNADDRINDGPTRNWKFRDELPGDEDACPHDRLGCRGPEARPAIQCYRCWLAGRTQDTPTDLLTEAMGGEE